MILVYRYEEKKFTNPSEIFFHSIENFKAKFSKQHTFDDEIPDKFVVEQVSMFYGINKICQAIHKQIYNVLKDVIRFHATKNCDQKKTRYDSLQKTNLF